MMNKKKSNDTIINNILKGKHIIERCLLRDSKEYKEGTQALKQAIKDIRKEEQPNEQD